MCRGGRGGGVQAQKTFRVGGNMGIFWNNTMVVIKLFSGKENYFFNYNKMEPIGIIYIIIIITFVG